jgi:hypothetical protein
MTDSLVLQQVHGRLDEIHEELVTLASRLAQADGIVRADTYFALGQAAGQFSKAKALLGRDIDDLGRTPK